MVRRSYARRCPYPFFRASFSAGKLHSGVLEVAQENARKFGVKDRYDTRPGSVFETELGSGYDFVLLTNIFHHFDMAACETLTRRVHTALKSGGKAITLEFVPNEDRISPPTAAEFSLAMLAGTRGGVQAPARSPA